MIQENIKFREIAEHIRTEFTKPHWVPGQKLDSEKKMMDQFGVSRITIRSALQRLEAEGIIAREQGKRSVLVQKPANKKKLRRGINFGLIGSEQIVDANQSDLPCIAISIIGEFSTWGATLSLFPFLSVQHPNALDFVKNLISRNLVDGFFISYTPDLLEVGEYLRERGIPFVYLLQHQQIAFPYLPGMQQGKLDFSQERYKHYSVVQAEEAAPTARIVRQLEKKGLRRLVLLGSRDDYSPQRTYDLFAEGAKDSGIEFVSESMVGASLKEIIEAVRRYGKPENCLLLSNEIVKEFDYAMEYLGLKSPEDVHVLLFKHYTPDWACWEEKYPVFCLNPVRFGQEVARLLYGLILEKESGAPPPENRIVKLERELRGRSL